MSALQVYLVHKNRYRAIFGRLALSLDSAQDRQALADSIDAELSPENLTCDGEISQAETNRRYRNLCRCAEELLSLDPSVKFYEYA